MLYGFSVKAEGVGGDAMVVVFLSPCLCFHIPYDSIQCFHMAVVSFPSVYHTADRGGVSLKVGRQRSVCFVILFNSYLNCL